MKKRYTLEIPLAGYVVVQVEAESEEEAIETALSNGACLEDIEEWDIYRRIVKGNVCYAPKWDIEVVDEEEIEGEQQ